MKVLNGIELVCQSLSDDLELIQDPFIARAAKRKLLSNRKQLKRPSHSLRRQSIKSRDDASFVARPNRKGKDAGEQGTHRASCTGKSVENGG